MIDNRLGNGRFRCDWCKKPIPKYDEPSTYTSVSGEVFHFCNRSQLAAWEKSKFQKPLEIPYGNTGVTKGSTYKTDSTKSVSDIKNFWIG